MKQYTNDEKATYDLNSGQYILTPSYFTECTGYSILDEHKDTDNTADLETLESNFLGLLSDVFYAFIYKYSQNQDNTRFYLASPHRRIDIIKGMMLLGRAWMINRYTPAFIYGKEAEDLVPTLVKQYCLNKKLAIRSMILVPFDSELKLGDDY